MTQATPNEWKEPTGAAERPQNMGGETAFSAGGLANGLPNSGALDESALAGGLTNGRVADESGLAGEENAIEAVVGSRAAAAGGETAFSAGGLADGLPNSGALDESALAGGLTNGRVADEIALAGAENAIEAVEGSRAAAAGGAEGYSADALPEEADALPEEAAALPEGADALGAGEVPEEAFAPAEGAAALDAGEGCAECDAAFWESEPNPERLRAAGARLAQALHSARQQLRAVRLAHARQLAAHRAAAAQAAAGLQREALQQRRELQIEHAVQRALQQADVRDECSVRAHLPLKALAQKAGLGTANAPCGEGSLSPDADGEREALEHLRELLNAELHALRQSHGYLFVPQNEVPALFCEGCGAPEEDVDGFLRKKYRGNPFFRR